nr:menaquinone-dependent protoporphyrinogen IX dehydrogenase [uncultured Cohaesibacter sp.]
MAQISLFFVSQDGQTEKIARTLSNHLENADQQVRLVDLHQGEISAQDIEAADLVIVLAAIRYGHHLKPADLFLKAHGDILCKKKLALLSVNLTARKLHKRTIEHSIYLQKWVKRHAFSPVLVRAIAGKLDYPSYGWFDRFMIQLIMRITKGPTDPSLTIEFTDWDQVKELAGELVELV